MTSWLGQRFRLTRFDPRAAAMGVAVEVAGALALTLVGLLIAFLVSRGA